MVTSQHTQSEEIVKETDPEVFPQWARQFLRKIASVTHGEVSLIIVNGQPKRIVTKDSELIS